MKRCSGWRGTSRFKKFAPMNPAPPVTSIFMFFPGETIPQSRSVSPAKRSHRNQKLLSHGHGHDYDHDIRLHPAGDGFVPQKAKPHGCLGPDSSDLETGLQLRGEQVVVHLV